MAFFFGGLILCGIVFYVRVGKHNVTKDGKTALTAVVIDGKLDGKLDGLLNGEKPDSRQAAVSPALKPTATRVASDSGEETKSPGPTPIPEWSAPVNLGLKFNTSKNDPVAMSADGLTLFVSGDRPGGFGDWDLWVSQRTSLDEEFAGIVNMGPELNSEYHEDYGFLSADGLTFLFASNRPGGQGDDDLWISHRPRRDANVPIKASERRSTRRSEHQKESPTRWMDGCGCNRRSAA